MRKFIPLIVLGVALSFTACNNNKKSEKEIDSLNQASADSLLNAALADSTRANSTVGKSIK
jgi:hypothetical protein